MFDLRCRSFPTQRDVRLTMSLILNTVALTLVNRLYELYR